ncbi:MAG: phenylalanine--tRNA ligase subunit beta [Candidatus Limnocylindrales bacterium]
MLVPLSWLRDYVDFDLPPERLAERLTTLGMEVQSIDRFGSGWSSVVVGELLEVTPHPNADRLSLTKVRVSESDAPLSIVCGATNIAVGQRVPVALPGAVLPGGRQIGVSTIQGTESQGMLCSGAELGLSADSDGILILDDPKAELGTPVENLVSDVVLDVDVKPNRGDALSLIGLAREVAAISGTTVRWPKIEVPESGDATDEHLWVEIADKRLCPRFVGRYVNGLKVGPSPVMVQLRLSAAGMRPVSNAVDASNYVMLEMGKPIHVFDAGSVSGGTIIVRAAQDGEKLETLDHVVRTLTPETLVIADAGGAIGIAGVIGGAGSEVGPQTTAVIVESAIFDPVSIRRTAHRFGLRSEASLRFEKSLESRLARVGADRTAQLLAEWGGGRPAVGVVDTNPVDEQPRRVVYRPARVSRLLGQQIETAEMRDALARVEIATEPVGVEDALAIVPEEQIPLSGEGEALVAVVPAHRGDIQIEADVAEEIARLRGYENLPPRLPDTTMPSYREDPRRFENALRDLLAGRGLAEVVTNGLVAPADHARLGLPADDPATIRVANPVTADHSELRRSLLPGLVSVLGRNERQRWPNVAIFEAGAVHEWRSEPSERDQLGMVLAGEWRSRSWSDAAREASVDDLKGILEQVASRFHLGSIAYRPTEVRAGIEHTGRTAEIVVTGVDGEPAVLGRVGELDPRYLAAYEIRAEHVSFAELELERLARAARMDPQVRDLGRLPAVERDLAVIVARDVAAADVSSAIRAHGGSYLVGVELFDRYQGPPLDAGEVSLAYRLRFQPQESPVSESQLEESIEAVTDALAREVGGRVRSGS